MKKVFAALMYVPPLIAGLGVISPYWIIGSVAAAFWRSIISVFDAKQRDYRDMPVDEFTQADKLVKTVTVFRVIWIAASYGLGFLIATLF